MDRRNWIAGALSLGIAPAAFARAPATLPLPKRAPVGEDEAYWARVRDQFLIPGNTLFMNPGTAGSSPRPVLDAVYAGFEDTEAMDDLPSDEYPIWGYKKPWDEFRRPLAAFLGCETEQLAMLRNTTEGNNAVAGGLKLDRGDEVILSNEEHRSLEQPWLQRSARDGIVVRRFDMPRAPERPEQIVERIEAAITPRTRLIFVSHVTSPTGIVLPVRDIAALARSRGILSAFDGAQVPGMLALNIDAIGCDIYTGSLHKWLHAPKGTGFLYVRDTALDRLWAAITTGGWDDPSIKAARFQHVGTSNLPLLWGMRAAIDFTNRIGIDRIEARQRALADYLHDQMIARGAGTWTSPNPSLRGAMATLDIAPLERMPFQDWLWRERKIRIRGSEPSRVRLCAPYFLSRADCDRFLEAFDAYRARNRT